MIKNPWFSGMTGAAVSGGNPKRKRAHCGQSNRFHLGVPLFLSYSFLAWKSVIL